MIELQATVTGRVQGVMYRAYVQEAATDLGVLGYIKNMNDGSVFVVAQGLPDVLKEFVEYLNEGSSLSRVESVGIDWRNTTATYGEFSVLH